MQKGLGKIIKEIGLQELEQALNEVKKTQLVKAKNRQSELLIVSKEAFIELIKSRYSDGLSQEFLDLIEPIIQLKSKDVQIYQYKYLVMLLREVEARQSLAQDGNQIQ